MPAHRPDHPAAADEARRARRARPAHRAAICDAADCRHGDRQLPAPPPEAGRRDDALFSDDAVALVHQTSRGYPRAVNNLALQALVAAIAADKAIVDESTTRTAIAEVTAD